MGDNPCPEGATGGTGKTVATVIFVVAATGMVAFSFIDTGDDGPFEVTETLPLLLLLLVSLPTLSPSIFNNLSVTGALRTPSKEFNVAAGGAEFVANVPVIKEGALGAVVVVVVLLILLLVLILATIGLFRTGEVVKEEFDKDSPANKSPLAASDIWTLWNGSFTPATENILLYCSLKK